MAPDSPTQTSTITGTEAAAGAGIEAPELLSEAWFAELAKVATNSLQANRIGFADLRLVLQIDQPGHPSRYTGIVMEGYEIESLGWVQDLDEFAPDAVVEGDLSAWTEMFGNIADHGFADGSHTFNALTMAGFPLTVVSEDPVKRDKVFRFAETIQHLLDSAAKL